MNPIDPLLTSEVARLLAVSPETVRIWERQGKLLALKTAGGVRLFDRRDVERLAREREAARSTNDDGSPATRAVAGQL